MPLNRQVAVAPLLVHRAHRGSHLRAATRDSSARSRSKMLLCVATYVLSFQWSYSNVLVPVYWYVGYRSSSSFGVRLLGIGLAVLPAVWMPSRLVRPSQLVYWLLYLTVIIPVATVTLHSYPGTFHYALSAVLSVIGAFALLGFVYKIPVRPYSRGRLQQHQFWAMLIVIAAASYTAILATFGLKIDLPSFSEVGLLRMEYKEALMYANPLVAYTVDWMGYVVNPFFIVVGFMSQRRLALVAGIVGQFLIYAITGFRTMLLSTFFLAALFILLRAPDRLGSRIGLSAVGMALGSSALYIWAGSVLLASLVLERLTAMPGLLTGYYFAFFTSNPKMLLSHSVLRHFITNPYSQEPPLLIGNTFFPGTGMYANVNLWADAFANFGYPGVLAFTALLGLLFWTYDSITARHGVRFSALVLAMPAVALANTGLLTCMLSHGMGFAFLVMLAAPIGLERPYRSSIETCRLKDGKHCIRRRNFA